MNELKKARTELIVMVFCSLFCVSLFVYIIPTFVFIPPASRHEAFNPRTFPYLLTTIIGICSFIGLIKSTKMFVQVKNDLKNITFDETMEEKVEHTGITKYIPMITYGLIVVYGFLISKIGFIIPSLIIPPLILFIIGSRKWVHYLSYFLFSAGMWVIFRTVLNVQLP